MRRKDWKTPITALAVIGLIMGALLGLISTPASTLAAVQEALSGGGKAAPAAQTVQRPETLVVRLYFKDTAERDRLATEWNAEEVATLNGYLTVLTDRAGYNSMLSEGHRAEIDQESTRVLNTPNLFGNDNNPNTFDGGYRTVEEMQTLLTTYATTYPTLAQVVDIGDSWCKQHAPCTLTNPALTWNGYDLNVLHITNQAIPGPKPVFWLETGIHSREIATPEMAIRYIQWLLDNYNSDPDAHWMVDYHDIWVSPMVNPDGHHMVEQGGNNPILQRKNANYTNGCTTWGGGNSQLGTDNNRNFPFLWGCCGGSSTVPCDQTYRGASAGSDPETQAVINQIHLLIADQRGPNITDAAPLTTTGVYQSMHSNASLNLFPWGFQVTPHAPNDAELRNIGHHMQAANAFPSGNGYTTGQPPEVLYAVDGDTADWGYGDLGIAAYTTEVGGSNFTPPYSQIDSSLWPLNKGALIYQGKIARTPYLLSHGPDANTIATTPMTVTQGTPSQLTGNINFAWSSNAFSQNVGAAEYYIDTPPWAGGTANAMTGTFTSPTVAVAATIDTTSLTPGRHIIFVRGRGAVDYQGFQTFGPVTAAWLWVLPQQGTPTPTVTGTPPTATRTVTPPAATPTSGGATATATPTVCSSASTWTDVAHVPVDKGRAVGVNFGTNIYVFGGRPDNTIYTQDVYKYDLTADSWTLLPQQLPDASSANMGGGLLTFPAGQRIFLVGGSATGSVATGRTLAFNPADGTFTAMATWPAAPIHLPGGWAVINNKFYVFGGYIPNVDMTNDIWSYDPMTNTWTQSAAVLSLARGYIATEAMPDGMIYLAGGSQYNGGNLGDETIFEKFNPATNTIASGPAMPVALSNDQGYNVAGKFVVPSGGFTSSVTDVVVYDPAANSWSMGVSTLFPVRNYAKGYGLNGAIHVIGGTADASAATYYAYNQKLTPGACGTVSPTPTVPIGATATATSTTTSSTPTATAISSTPTVVATVTPCPIQFTDVLPADPFYSYIRCLACRNIISGYTTTPPCATGSTPCYNGGANVTRGQVAKIVSNAAGYADPIPSTQQTFTDVPYTNPFWVYIERLAEPGRGYISGYSTSPPCTTGTPCFLPFNNVTRGQMAKIDANAGGYFEAIPSTQQTFTDVPNSNPFWVYIERAALHGVISGYSTSPPCPGGTPCFLWANNLTRNQAAKVVAVTFYPNCQTPVRTGGSSN